MPVQDIPVMPWLLQSAHYKIFFSSPNTISIPQSPTPRKPKVEQAALLSLLSLIMYLSLALLSESYGCEISHRLSREVVTANTGQFLSLQRLWAATTYTLSIKRKNIYIKYQPRSCLSTKKLGQFFSFLLKEHCSTTGKPTRSFATERVSLDSV